jgi:radical SAM protein with 4Fe4S-binding SPASM domain
MRYIHTGLNIIFKPLKVEVLPVHMILEPTTFCMLSCNMCKRDKYVKESKHLSFSEFKYMFDQIIPKRLTLSGLGEPLTNPELFDMIKYANRYGTIVSTTTSMAISSAKLNDIIHSGLHRLKISLDGATPEVYNDIRGQNIFNRVVRNIQKLVMLKKQYHIKLPYVCLQVVIQSKNIFQLSDIVKLGIKLDIDAISFKFVGLSGIEERKYALTYGLSYEVVSQQIYQAKSVAKKSRLQTNLDELLNNKYYQNIVLPENNRNGKKYYTNCLFPWFSVYITVNGEVKPCCLFSYVDNDFGNILKDDFRDIWNSPQYQTFRKLLKNKELPHARCGECVPEDIFDVVSALKRIIS